MQPDEREAAKKAWRWLMGGVWATVLGYGSASLVDKIAGFGWVFAVAIAAQAVCFALWWHYMNESDRLMLKSLAAQGVSLDVPREPGLSGFVDRHPILFFVAVGIVVVGGIFLVVILFPA
jgi:hypothetical protein